ncbi:electron transport chain [Homalodisca vitripennis]|nr:electron transport chain [Homalodisca vitripennis]
MGGDHHHHHKVEVPDYRIYKVEDCPELVRVQQELARKGLKDPWLRLVTSGLFSKH